MNFWDDASVAAAKTLVELYKAPRGLLDPLTTNYFRLWERPAASPAGVDLTQTVGWLSENPTARQGLVFLARQLQSPDSAVALALSRPHWPWRDPAPALVAARSAGATPRFTLLAGGSNGSASFSISPDGAWLNVTIPYPGTQLLLGYSF